MGVSDVEPDVIYSKIAVNRKKTRSCDVIKSISDRVLFKLESRRKFACVKRIEA